MARESCARVCRAGTGLRRALLPDNDIDSPCYRGDPPHASKPGNQDLLPLATLPKLGGRDEAASIDIGLRPGRRLGPYELSRELGAGGMAVVWLAQRVDGAFKRTVALKLPMISASRGDLARRFARERDILAALEHPNIARLYDAGVSDDGLPYLALEFVDGRTLTEWCDTHRLGLRERLKLFLQVLDAVHYAHRRQVIHRDIKPANIPVTESSQVRLLDFGVAKLIAAGQDESASSGATLLTRSSPRRLASRGSRFPIDWRPAAI